jgi:transmembrane sensor
LGTAFNIKAFPEENEVTVTVSRGKVKVSADKKLVGVLIQDQQVTIKNGVVDKDLQANAREAIAWMEADIVFDDVTLKEALEELEERFNTKIVLSDERAYDCRFTGSFVHGENIEQVLLVICEFNNVTMHHNTEIGAYEISGAGCN